MLVKKKTIVAIIIYAFCCMFFSFDIYTDEMNKLLAIGTLIFSAFFWYKCRNSNMLFLLATFILYSNYSICVGIYLFPDMRPKYLYPQITDVSVYGIGILMLFLFSMMLCILTPLHIADGGTLFSNLFIKNENENRFLFVILTAIFCTIMVVGYSTNSGSRGASSPLYEYDIIFLILMLYFSGNNKFAKTVCLICGGVYTLTSFTNGTRVEAVACVFVLIICLTKRRFNKGVFAVGGILGIILLQVIGMARGNYENGMLSAVIQETIDSKLVFDTCTHAYFPALCMIEEFKTFEITNAFYFLSRFLFSNILGSNNVTDGNLITYVRHFYYHNYGGVTTGFFYVWFGYFGALVYAFVVKFYMKVVMSIEQKKSPVVFAAALYTVSTVSRWYLYGPWPLIRGVLFCSIIVYVFILVDKSIRCRRTRLRFFCKKE